MMTSEKWKTMNITEKYTVVFGPNDPSRRKLEELPYFISVVSRDRNGRCAYCSRESCTGCPLRFDDKQTLRDLLDQSGISTETPFYYAEHKPEPHQIKKQAKQKKKVTRQQASKARDGSSGSYIEDYTLPQSPEFEITV